MYFSPLYVATRMSTVWLEIAPLFFHAATSKTPFAAKDLLNQASSMILSFMRFLISFSASAVASKYPYFHFKSGSRYAPSAHSFQVLIKIILSSKTSIFKRFNTDVRQPPLVKLRCWLHPKLKHGWHDGLYCHIGVTARKAFSENYKIVLPANKSRIVVNYAFPSLANKNLCPAIYHAY